MNIRLHIEGYSQQTKSAEDLIQAFFEQPLSFLYDHLPQLPEQGDAAPSGGLPDSPSSTLAGILNIQIFKELMSLREVKSGSSPEGIVYRAHAVWQGTDGAKDVQEESETWHAESADPEAAVERRTMLRSILKVLERATGWQLPWGILTGVRPTKRMHQLLDQMDADRAAAMLRHTYALSEAKVNRIRHIATLQRSLFPQWNRLDEEVSLYIGIPFCPTKCAYCTFPAYDIRGQQGSVDGFLKGLLYEFEQLGEWFRRNPVNITTVYWGGGTPTSITAEEMDMLYEALNRHIPAARLAREITVEAGRPDTITPEKLAVLKKWGVHRISVNPQSFTQETLDLIGRDHTVEETVQAMSLARSCGMDNINMDLIVGLPNEHLRHVEHSLAQITPWQPESLTVHTLSFKRASEMTQNRTDYEVATREEIHRMVAAAEQWTAANGYEPYYLYRQKNILGNLENVGYAKPGYASLYNILMMEEVQTIIGLGCGAVSRFVWKEPGDETGNGDRIRIERLANPKDPRSYMLQIEQESVKKLAKLDSLKICQPVV